MPVDSSIIPSVVSGLIAPAKLCSLTRFSNSVAAFVKL
jgi:hypothetical protein